MKKLVVVMGMLLLAAPVYALEDTPENRAKEAERYLAASSVRETLQEVPAQMADEQPAEKRELFKTLVAKYFVVDTLMKRQSEALVKLFTADELRYLADTASSEFAKTISSKMSTFMSEMSPEIQTEALNAYASALGDLDAIEEKGKTKAAE